MTARAKKKPIGTVAFVGAGPGDAGLLTVRATEVLAAADTVVVDSGAREEVVRRHSPSGVEVLDAGFGENGQPLTHAGRAKIVTRAAKAGARVVRLLDGDAATFAGLAEEVLACHKAGIGFEVVPGVAAASAVPLYAGVPLTTAQTGAVHVVDAGATRLDVSGLLDPKATVVLVGGGDDLVAAADALVGAGRADDTEVALTAHGTTTRQRTETTTLGAVHDALAALDGPLVAVIGPGVALRDRAAWFENKPLFGWRVLVPRTQQQSGPMCARLAEYGAVSDVVPTISVEPPRTPHQMEKAVKGLVTGRYEWVGFTSVNAVRAVRDKFVEFG
ncbi:MAG TPA: SAM-dependent methyltransferase, partial [Actinomycetales bacterium]|nr:SAM-dependent methyltransferase [Actinomycetales bacterium]